MTFAAGCGGDDDPSPSPTTEAAGATGATGSSGSAALPTDVVEQGNQICLDGNEELDQAFGQLGGKPSPDEFAQAVTDVIVPNIQGQIDDLRALSDDEELNSVLDQAENELADVSDDPTLLQGDAFTDTNEKLSALGLTTCAS